ncbi:MULTISPECIES: D-aminoacyl-tRNA deacylase [unclassified Ruegeria]|uniref:D-aminoacyl-tRNA deacylase n=1 Tax=unclassified Ruegeria TaxID=2625375 RepID=UPI001488DF06|nr:D-tyrosyl-tRNA(Tyr) deacylase [Ruegeria sp. HKCCD7296]NOE34854.1 D-tyrosyl-tRNA(Tyr) deacylase [Ruegeria sp. HKCCD7318]NOE41930.1 D-tyrosyl-tRNA(Tyr) deacylase [Ruegeria sp. HKCCD7319]
MRAVLQRVSYAKVSVDDAAIGSSGPGLMILVCAMQGDDEMQARKLAEKAAKLRIFKDDSGKMNRSLLDVGGSALVISQFTLAADTTSGNRPGFSNAAPPDQGEHLYKEFAAHLGAQGVAVETGQFGADMAVELVNDGPVTIWIEN